MCYGVARWTIPTHWATSVTCHRPATPSRTSGSAATKAPTKERPRLRGFDEFENTTVGLLAVAGGSFLVAALAHLRSVCRAVNAWVLLYQTAIPNVYEQFDGGAIVDDTIADRVETLGERAVEFARIEPDPACFESEVNIWPSD